MHQQPAFSHSDVTISTSVIGMLSALELQVTIFDKVEC